MYRYTPEFLEFLMSFEFCAVSRQTWVLLAIKQTKNRKKHRRGALESSALLVFSSLGVLPTVTLWRRHRTLFPGSHSCFSLLALQLEPCIHGLSVGISPDKYLISREEGDICLISCSCGSWHSYGRDLRILIQSFTVPAMCRGCTLRMRVIN